MPPATPENASVRGERLISSRAFSTAARKISWAVRRRVSGTASSRSGIRTWILKVQLRFDGQLPIPRRTIQYGSERHHDLHFRPNHRSGRALYTLAADALMADHLGGIPGHPRYRANRPLRDFLGRRITW